MAPREIPTTTLQEVVARLMQGAALIGESRKLGFSHNGPLRDALRGMLGAEKYSALMHNKRPRVAGGARRAPKGEGATMAAAPARPNDEGVRTVKSMSKRDGWTWRHVSEHPPIPRRIVLKKGEGAVTVSDCGENILIVRDPSGVEYVAAMPHERADLLRSRDPGFGDEPLRFVQWEGSAWQARIAKHAAKYDKEMAAGEAHVERVKAKRARKAEAKAEARKEGKRAKGRKAVQANKA